MLERIEREAGIPGLVALLAERLSPTDLQSLLLEVYRQHAHNRPPSAVLADHESNRFVRPSTLSPLVLLEWERTAFMNLPAGFEPVELSPVCPLGTNSAVATTDQNRAVSTIRNTEVVSDSSNVLALEGALRRRQILRDNPKSTMPVHLAASHRLLRAQRFDGPHSVTHFSIFTLCSTGRGLGGLQFEITTLVLHIGFYLRALMAYIGPDVPLRLAVTDFSANTRQTPVAPQILALVQEDFPHVECVIDEQRTGGQNYYADLCFHIYAAIPSGEMLELVDGGAVDWTQKLLANAKERCVISGIGSERVCMEFGHGRL